MKNIKVLCTLMCMLLSVSLYAQDAGKLIGSWTYSALDAPYGYQEGSIDFKLTDGKLSAELKIQGSVIRVEDIKQDKNRYLFDLYVDGSPVSMEIIQKKNLLEGTANAEGRIISVAFKHDKK